MAIIRDYPPLIDEIDRRFKVRGKPIFYAWGEDIYNPLGRPIPLEIMAHEAVHQERQLAHLHGVEGWWRDYLDNDHFRYNEERHAHIAEYRAILALSPNRHDRRRALKHVAAKLAAPLYGLDLTTTQAKAVLLQTA